MHLQKLHQHMPWTMLQSPFQPLLQQPPSHHLVSSW
uniref:Uncharacterized protein n=1 Tax=Arundo donax TaxID=35708 RepID=A0A0A9EUU6_ARUDO